MSQVQWKMESKIGPLYLVASELGLQGIFWNQQGSHLLKSFKGAEDEVIILKKAVTELEEYLSGNRRKFSLPFDLKGTPFQKRVWEQLMKIPYGKTCSYQEIARQIKNEKAIRAVGSANGKNPLCIVIPCHRVIASNGTLGGYSGGLEIKEKLLELERKCSSQ
jgi:methylated-DNA-[protein]-cysteine S-methyltransferase